MTKHISHTCGRRSCRPTRYLSSSTQPYFRTTALRVSSSTTTGHYVLNKDVDPKRLGSESNAIKEAQQSHTSWHSWYSVAAARAVASCTFIFHETFFFAFVGKIRPIPWFLTEAEVEVLVDPSTWTNQNKVEPGTNDRDHLSSLIVRQSYVRVLLLYST